MATRIRSRPEPPVREIARWAWLVMILALAGIAAVAAGKTEPRAAGPPETLTFPSAVGKVTFPHAMHVRDLGMECTDCHHEVRAKRLSTPHPQYLAESRVNCRTCHHGGGEPGAARRCGVCHHRAGDIADETLSAKVVIHKTCERCHEIGTGSEAGGSCKFCHSGPRRPW